MSRQLISIRLRLRRYFTYLSLFLIVGFLGLFVTQEIFNSPKAKAAVSRSGSNLTITASDGSNYFYINEAGNIYGDNGFELYDETYSGGQSILDRRYYAYAFALNNPLLGTIQTTDNVTIAGSATVIAEKINCANLTFQDQGQLTHPMVNRDNDLDPADAAEINRPAYRNDYWGVEFVGYYVASPNSSTYFTLADYDDAAAIQVGTGDLSNINQTNWLTVYSNNILDHSTDSSWSGNKFIPNSSQYIGNLNGIRTATTNSNGSAVAYIPVRILVADNEGDTSIKVNYSQYEASGNNPIPGGTQVVPTSQFFSANSTGAVTTNGSALTMKYYLANVSGQNDKMLGFQQQQGFSNGVMTGVKQSLSLDYDLSAPGQPASGNYGCNGGSECRNHRLGYYWGGNEMQTPFGSTANRRESPLQTRAFRHTTQIFNDSASDTVYTRSDGQTTTFNKNFKGLEIQLSDSLIIRTDPMVSFAGPIDVSGAGFPGSINELVNDSMQSGMGAGPAGGYNSEFNQEQGVGGGGGHYGYLGSTGGASYSETTGLPDGYPARRSDLPVSNQVVLADPNDPITDEPASYRFNFGSGGGASSDLYTGWSIGGAGGGAISIVAQTIKVEPTSTLSGRQKIINANGVLGEVYQVDSWLEENGLSGGGGGAIEVRLTGSLEYNTNSRYMLISAAGGDSEFVAPAYHRLSGGGGGFMMVSSPSFLYNAGSIAETELRLSLDVTGGIGQNLARLNDWDKTGIVSNLSGSNGQMRITNPTTGISIKKSFEPLKRNGVVATFNPYGLQKDDQIKVILELTNLTIGAPITIKDDFLNVSPAGTPICRCDVNPIAGSPVACNSNFPAISNSSNISWTITPSSSTQTLEYICRVVD